MPNHIQYSHGGKEFAFAKRREKEAQDGMSTHESRMFISFYLVLYSVLVPSLLELLFLHRGIDILTIEDDDLVCFSV